MYTTGRQAQTVCVLFEQMADGSDVGYLHLTTGSRLLNWYVVFHQTHTSVCVCACLCVNWLVVYVCAVGFSLTFMYMRAMGRDRRGTEGWRERERESGF